MGLSSFLIFVFCAVVEVFALPSEILDRETDASFYSSTWGDGTAKYTYTNGANGQYGVVWSGNKGNFVVGKGYNPGGPRYD
jgi:endo-1,4-beta-xylanase